MAIGLLQSAVTHSVAPAPASITPTLGAGSTAGNLLLIVVVVSGSSPTITTPTNWTLIQSVGDATIRCALFAFPINSGGITSVAVTLGSTTAGGAAAGIFEFNGQGTLAQYQQLINSYNVAPVVSTSFANVFPNGPISNSQQLFVYITGRVFGSSTQVNTGLNWSAALFDSSTGATTDVIFSLIWGVNPGPGMMPVTGGTLGSSVDHIQIGAHWNSIGDPTLGLPFGFTTVGGSRGCLVGNFYQGIIGG